MIKYLLLAITWIVILGINIYRTANDNFDIWLWILLVAIAIVPLAERLKIGELFDFGSKTTNKKDVRDSTNIVNYSAQSLILNILSEKQTVKELRASPMPQLDLKDDILTDQDKRIIDFMYNADKALYGLSCIVRPMYFALLIRQERNSSSLNNARFKEILHIVNTKSFREVLEASKEIPTVLDLPVDKALIDTALELLTFRELIDKDESNLPDVATCKTLVGRVLVTVDYLSGMVQTGISIALNPTVLLSVSKPK